MAKVLVNESSLSGIAEAIRAKNGTATTYKPSQMAAAIEAIETGGGGGGSEEQTEFIQKWASNQLTEIKASNLLGVTTIAQGAFEYQSKLTKVVLPDTVTSLGQHSFSNCAALKEVQLPKYLTSLAGTVFSNSAITTLTFYHTIPTVGANTFDGMGKLTTIYVPGEKYDDYLNYSNWGTFRRFLTPNSKYVGIASGVPMEFNNTKEYSIELKCFDVAPTDYSITANDPELATITEISATTTALTFTVNSLQKEGTLTVTVTVPGDNGYTFNRTVDIVIMEEIPESTYEVVAIDGVTYGFALNDNGYYESTNQKKANSYSYCRVNIHNTVGRTMYLDCISYGESNYDYGILSRVNCELTKTASDDTAALVQQSFKGMASANVQTITYTDAVGECFITVKFRKDSSGDNNNDSLQFKVRFAE